MLFEFQVEILISYLLQINHQVRSATTPRPPNFKPKSRGQAWRIRCYLREREAERERERQRQRVTERQTSQGGKSSQKLSEEATMDVAPLALATPDDIMRISLALLSLFKIYNLQYHEQS